MKPTDQVAAMLQQAGENAAAIVESDAAQEAIKNEVAAADKVSQVAPVVQETSGIGAARTTARAEESRILSQSDRVSLTPLAQSLINTLDVFENTCAPRAIISAENLLKQQTALYNAVKNAIALEDATEMATFFNYWFSLIRANKRGTWKGENLFRRISHVRMSDKDYRAYINFLDLVLVLSNVNSRKTISKDFKVEGTLGFIKSEANRTRVAQYVARLRSM